MSERELPALDDCVAEPDTARTLQPGDIAALTITLNWDWDAERGKLINKDTGQDLFPDECGQGAENREDQP